MPLSPFQKEDRGGERGSGRGGFGSANAVDGPDAHHRRRLNRPDRRPHRRRRRRTRDAIASPVFWRRPLAAVGTDLWFAAITKLFATRVHHGHGLIDWPVAKRLWWGSTGHAGDTDLRGRRRPGCRIPGLSLFVTPHAATTHRHRYRPCDSVGDVCRRGAFADGQREF